VIHRGTWTADEDNLLFEKIEEYGQDWSEISKSFNGRTPNAIKNRWHWHIRGLHLEMPYKEQFFFIVQPQPVRPAKDAHGQEPQPPRAKFPPVVNLPFPRWVDSNPQYPSFVV
jgi:hypothetical protein